MKSDPPHVFCRENIAAPRVKLTTPIPSSMQHGWVGRVHRTPACPPRRSARTRLAASTGRAFGCQNPGANGRLIPTSFSRAVRATVHPKTTANARTRRHITMARAASACALGLVKIKHLAFRRDNCSNKCIFVEAQFKGVRTMHTKWHGLFGGAHESRCAEFERLQEVAYHVQKKE